jgi:hypothetical protein
MDAGPLARRELGSDSNPSPFEPIYALSRPEFSRGRCRLACPSLLVTGGIQHVQQADKARYAAKEKRKKMFGNVDLIL